MGRLRYTPQIKLDLLEADRQKKALTIQEVALRCEPPIGRPMASHVFNGHSQSLSALRRIAKVLGHTIDRYLDKPKMNDGND